VTQRTHYPIAVMLTARDMKRTTAFFRDTLGFTLEQAWPDKENPMWANFLLDGQSVMFSALMSSADVEKMCAGDPEAIRYMKTLSDEFQSNRPGCGVCIYIQVPDVDAFHARVTSKGVTNASKPKNQFYGQRDFGLQDPEGYRFIFYTAIKMTNCQSCGMPLADAHPGQLYCQYCTDEKGKLRPYEQVFEGTVTGYFMGMQKMARPDAERAAREHLKTMPAWAGRT
jgi:uncharacterized glyoxalase superfamily protein PhnB